MRPSLIPLTPCTLLRLRGPDRTRYLNGQVTQDVRLATESRAVFACVLNAKGKLEAVCHVREHDDSYLLDAPLSLREILRNRLERYLIADDVELIDESEQWHLAHLRPEEFPHPQRGWHCTRFGEPGLDLLAESPIALDGVETVSGEALEELRLARGLPKWGAELTPGLLAPEAGIEPLAISYDKGCYIGQEVISRIKYAGKTNRQLVRLAVPSGTPVPCQLVASPDETDAGLVTSVGTTPHPRHPDHVRALGFRRRKAAGLGTFALRTIEGAPLPGTAMVEE